MATILDIRKLKLPHLSRTAVVLGALVLVLVLTAAIVGWQVYRKLTTNTVVAYFSSANALYPGDKVEILGVRVGSIDSIEPTGDAMKVTFHYQNKHPVPADATATILNPSLVASRTLQLGPRYSGGPMLADGAVIPLERTQVPVEWDQLRDELGHIVDELGPTPQQPKGPIGELIESFADGLDGKGKAINKTLTSLSEAISALNEGRGDFFSVVRSLALFVNTLRVNDEQFAALNSNLAQFTGALTNSDRELATAVDEVDALVAVMRTFIEDNGSQLAYDVAKLAETTTAIMQPEPREGLEQGLHVLPNTAANLAAIYEPAHGATTGSLVVTNFANPLQAVCSIIQAGSRLGYQESAELCAQYLGPIFDAIKFNFPPFGMNMFSTASTLREQVDYSEARLRPPPGFKPTTVPGVFSPDTIWSHRNHEPGWRIAPGMEGLALQPFTQQMLAPADLAGLLGSAPPPPAPLPPAPLPAEAPIPVEAGR